MHRLWSRLKTFIWPRFAIALVAIGALLGSIALVDRQTPEKANDGSRLPVKLSEGTQLAPDRKDIIQPDSARQVAGRVDERPLSMLDLFNRATSYRAFLAAALNDPRSGGFVYVQAVMYSCKTFLETVKDQSSVSAPQDLARNLLSGRCDFSEEEAFQQLNGALFHDGKTLQSDSLLALFFRHVDNIEDPKSALALASDLLSNGDPIALEALLTLSAVPTSSGDVSGKYFDGQWYRSPEEQRVADDAWLLASCAIGVACGADSTAALFLCVQRDWCANGVSEALESGYGQHDPESWNAVRSLSNRMLAAVKEKDGSRFVAPKSLRP